MTVSIISRGVWGARHQDGDLDLFGLADEVAVHHSAVPALPADAAPSAEHQAMRNLEAVGQERFGTGISYNVVVFPSGRAYRGVSWNRRGTHTGGHNSTVRSICFAGNFEHDEPTPAALATAAAILAEGRGQQWRQDAPLRGHRDYKSTACPGKNLYPKLPAIAAGRVTQEETMSAEAERSIAAVEGAIAGTITDAGEEITPREALERILRETGQIVTKVDRFEKAAATRHLADLSRHKDLAKIVKAIDAGATPDDIDPKALAEALAAALPPTIAQDVVDALGAQLAK